MGMNLPKDLEAKVLAAAGITPPKTARQSPPTCTGGPTRLVVEIEVPVRLASEANARGRLREKIGRKSAVKAAVLAALPRIEGGFPLPVVVTITRLGGKELDRTDNLPRSAKPVIDVVATWLGCTDGPRDKRVRWVVRQRPAYLAGVRVRIEFQGGPTT